MPVRYPVRGPGAGAWRTTQRVPRDAGAVTRTGPAHSLGRKWPGAGRPDGLSSRRGG